MSESNAESIVTEIEALYRRHTRSGTARRPSCNLALHPSLLSNL